MSDVDPYLQPREENNIIAADVVEGNLILRRYDGTEEIVPLGGPSLNAAPVVYILGYDRTGAPYLENRLRFWI